MLGEVLAVGALAGALGLGVSVAVGRLLGLHLGWEHALLAVPVGLGLALAAGIAPAVRAARIHPAGGLWPRVAPVRRAHRVRSVAGLALVNPARVPGRTALAAGALATGVGAVTLLTAIALDFHGTLVGTLLGDAVALRVRGVDTAAVAATVVLGVLSVADVLYLNIRERAAELATLGASGWSDGALARLITYEGLGIGLLGALAGAAAGLAGATWLAGGLHPAMLLTAGLVAAAATLLAGGASLVPALMLRRHPLTPLLAED